MHSWFESLNTRWWFTHQFSYDGTRITSLPVWRGRRGLHCSFSHFSSSPTATFRVYYYHLASDSTFHISYSVLNEKKDPIKARKQIHHFLNWKSKHRQELIQQLNHYHQGPDLSLSLWLLFHAMVLPQPTLLLLNTSWLPCCGSKMTVTVSPSTIKGKKSGLSPQLTKERGKAFLKYN